MGEGVWIGPSTISASRLSKFWLNVFKFLKVSGATIFCYALCFLTRFCASKGDDSEYEAYLANATRLAESKLSNAQKDLNSATTTNSKVDDKAKTSSELEDRVKEVCKWLSEDVLYASIVVY